MRHIIRFTLALVVVLAAPTMARAEAANLETFTGTMVCAQCKLQKPDAHECQDVLLVKNPKGETTEYYIVKNEVSKEAGEACTTEVPATVTGTVSEKDGKKWLAATKIEKSASAKASADQK